MAFAVHHSSCALQPALRGRLLAASAPPGMHASPWRTHLQAPSFMRSSRRPGVATTMDAPLRSAATWSRLGTPPYTHTVLRGTGWGQAAASVRQAMVRR